MTQYANTAEGGTNGTTVTTANSGGGSGDAWDVVNIGATFGALVYDNAHAAHGSLAYKITQGNAAETTDLVKLLANSVATTVAVRFYVYLTGIPGSTLFICRLIGSATRRAELVVTTTGKLQARDSASATIFTFTGSIPLNQWVRVEAQWTISTTVGQGSVQQFNTPDSSTADETQTSAANKNFGGPVDRVAYGIGVSTANLGPFWLDDLAENDTGTAIGPIPGAASGSLSLSGSVGAAAAVGAAGSLTLGGSVLRPVLANGSLTFGSTVAPTPVYLATFTVDAGMELSDIPLLPADTPTGDYVGNDDSDLVDYPDPTLDEWGRPIAS